MALLRQRATRSLESDVLALPDVLSGTFDIVLTYHGTICWLPDIRRWGQVVSHFLKPGGFVYIADTHPLASLYEPAESGGPLRLERPYAPPHRSLPPRGRAGSASAPCASSACRR